MQTETEERAETLTEQNYTELSRIKIYLEDRVSPSLVTGARGCTFSSGSWAGMGWAVFGKGCGGLGSK